MKELLNVDYKIITKVLAYRIKDVLPIIIDDDQTGYVKNRYIGETIHVIQYIMEYTNVTKNIPEIFTINRLYESF